MTCECCNAPTDTLLDRFRRLWWGGQRRIGVCRRCAALLRFASHVRVK